MSFQATNSTNGGMAYWKNWKTADVAEKERRRQVHEKIKAEREERRRRNILKAIEQSRPVEDRNDPRVLKWRRKVLNRDHRHCVKCGTTRNLQVHHIKPWKQYPKLRIEVSNGLTLCGRCHCKTHPWLYAQLMEAQLGKDHMDSIRAEIPA